MAPTVGVHASPEVLAGLTGEGAVAGETSAAPLSPERVTVVVGLIAAGEP